MHALRVIFLIDESTVMSRLSNLEYISLKWVPTLFCLIFIFMSDTFLAGLSTSAIAKLQTVAPTAKTFSRAPISFFLLAPTKAGNIIKMRTNIIFFIFYLVAFLMISKETSRQRRHNSSAELIDTMRITTRPYQTTSNTAQERSDDAPT
ncbi:hypothetical protein CIK95_00145 [Prevotella sp. P5-108]|nr:hypothetical protein CIK95_00145 [Prevotella sp. P5-108]